jgi:hypothetical protein
MQYTQTSKHTAPQLYTPLHCTLNLLVTTEVTHSGGAALRTRPRHKAAAPSTTLHGQHLHHSAAVAVGSYTTAVAHSNCDMHDQRTCVALVRMMYCTGSANTRATPLSHCKAMAIHAYAQRTRSAQEQAVKHPQSQAALRGHTSTTGRRGAATHTRQA